MSSHGVRVCVCGGTHAHLGLAGWLAATTWRRTRHALCLTHVRDRDSGTAQAWSLQRPRVCISVCVRVCVRGRVHERHALHSATQGDGQGLGCVHTRACAYHMQRHTTSTFIHSRKVYAGTAWQQCFCAHARALVCVCVCVCVYTPSQPSLSAYLSLVRL